MRMTATAAFGACMLHLVAFGWHMDVVEYRMSSTERRLGAI